MVFNVYVKAPFLAAARAKLCTILFRNGYTINNISSFLTYHNSYNKAHKQWHAQVDISGDLYKIKVGMENRPWGDYYISTVDKGCRIHIWFKKGS